MPLTIAQAISFYLPSPEAYFLTSQRKKKSYDIKKILKSYESRFRQSASVRRKVLRLYKESYNH